MEPMAVGAAIRGEPARRGDEQRRSGQAVKHPGQHRCEEAEGGRHVASGFRHDLMQGPAGETAQMRINGRQAEGEGARFDGDAPSQQTAQFSNDFRAFVGGMGNGRRHAMGSGL